MVDNCVFCQIANGKAPSKKVYEDDEFISFLDIRPLTRGNTLVIPKKHYRWVIDVDNFAGYWQVAKKVGLATKKAFTPDWICYLTLGLEVPHAHIRVIPRYQDDLHGVVVDIEKYEEFSEDNMENIAKQIKREIGGV